MTDEFQEMKVIEEAVFKTVLSDKDRAEVMRLLDRIAELTRERDEARAEVASIHTFMRDAAARAEWWLAKEPERPDYQAAATAIRMLATDIDARRFVSHPSDLDEANERGAASERAAIVKHLKNRADSFGYACGESCTYDDAAEEITRLDHHREPGKKRGE